jgi:hypothetical protein
MKKGKNRFAIVLMVMVLSALFVAYHQGWFTKAEPNTINMTVKVNYVDGSSRIVQSKPSMLSITDDSGKAISSVSVNVLLYLEFKGTVSSAVFTGSLVTSLGAMEKQRSSLNFPVGTVQSGKTYTLGSTVVTESNILSWISVLGTYTLSFQVPSGSVLVVTFADGKVDTKTFTEAKATLGINVASDSSITAANIGIESGTTVIPVQTPWLHTSGTKILNENNEEVIWNGISTPGLFGYWMYPWETSIQPSDLAIIRSHGLNYIRVDLSLDMAVRDQTPGTPTKINYDPRFWAFLDSIVSSAEQAGIWCTICFVESTWTNTGGEGYGFPNWMYDGSWSYFNKIYPNTVTGRGEAVRDFFNLDDPIATNVRTTYQTFWKDIATRYKNSGHVVFSLFNEPLCVPSYQMFDDVPPHPSQPRMAQLYKTFMEQTVDAIRSIEGGTHLVIINEAYFWYFETNLKVDRPNIVVENHGYWTGSDMTSNVQGCAQLAWRYNQPFVLGEFGGIEQTGLQDRTAAIATMQACNLLNVGWCYLWYSPSRSHPSAQTWIDIENNLHPNLVHYH